MSFYTTSITDLDAASRNPTDAERDAVERRKPVELRIDAVLAAIPAAVARQGLPFAYLQGQLRGRSRGTLVCHPGELSRALRKRGWTARRHWERRDEGGALTLWYPPGVNPVHESIASRLKLPRGRPPKWLQHARKLAREAGLVF